MRGLLSTFSPEAAQAAALLEAMGAGGELGDAASAFETLADMIGRLGPFLEDLPIDELRRHSRRPRPSSRFSLEEHTPGDFMRFPANLGRPGGVYSDSFGLRTNSESPGIRRGTEWPLECDGSARDPPKVLDQYSVNYFGKTT